MSLADSLSAASAHWYRKVVSPPRACSGKTSHSEVQCAGAAGRGEK